MRSNADHAGDRAGDRAGTKRRYTVAEAAGVLGLSAEAVRSRLARGTLEGIKENGTVYVVLAADQAHDQAHDQAQPNGDRASARAPDQTALVDVLRDQVEDLRRRLDSAEEANRENRRIIAALTQRIPELPPASSSQDAPGARETAGNGSGGVESQEDGGGRQERSSWWRTWFGFE